MEKVNYSVNDYIHILQKNTMTAIYSNEASDIILNIVDGLSNMSVSDLRLFSNKIFYRYCLFSREYLPTLYGDINNMSFGLALSSVIGDTLHNVPSKISKEDEYLVGSKEIDFLISDIKYYLFLIDVACDIDVSLIKYGHNNVKLNILLIPR